MRKFVFAVFMVLSAYSLACAVTVEVRVDNPIVPVFSIVPEFTQPLISLTVIDSSRIDPKYTACTVFGYARALPLALEVVEFEKKLLLCTDGITTYTSEISGEERFKGKFVLKGEVNDYEKAVRTILLRDFYKSGCTENGVSIEPENWTQCIYPEYRHMMIDTNPELTLKIQYPTMVLSPYDTFTISLIVE
jgi:hypothetical protein